MQYRYGFNGKEKDTEWDGGGSMYDYGFRIYNPRIARFLSVDPLTSEYVDLTPYQFASNTPIAAIDIDGLEGQLGTEAPNIGTVIEKTDKKLVQELAAEAAKNAAKNGGSAIAKSAPKTSPNGLGLFTKANLIVAIAPIFYSGETQYTPDELYERHHKIKPLGSESPVVVQDYEENTKFDFAMERQGYFVGTPQTSKSTDEDDSRKEYYIHYTNRKGIVGIASSGILLPNKKGKVYLTKAFLSEEEVENLLFLGLPQKKGYGKYMVIFNVDPDQNSNIEKDPSSILEYFHKGGILRIRHKNLIYIGPNTKKKQDNTDK